MSIEIRKYESDDVMDAIGIWNLIIEEGRAFPQLEILDEVSGDLFFKEQSFTGVAYNSENDEIVGLYILHPNNVGRCGHICNASYAVKAEARGRHIGKQLVLHCMGKAREIGFTILQFNAVAVSNLPALHLYENLGFTKLGIIPNGFLRKDGGYDDIIPHYKLL
ncbi:MAG: GNAT family N-acetyltransferase [Clostridiales bacterium]|nr:GNAT family N-acetyltransferase [Clostridiales bacterium]